MRNIVIVLFVSLIFMYSCQEDDADPGCNINGVWVGNWESTTTEAGAFISLVEQESSSFNGKVMLRMYSDNSQNFVSNYSASVKNEVVSGNLNFYNIKVSIDGNVTNDQDVLGNFQVSQLDMSGTFEGSKLQSSKPNLKEIFKYESSDPADGVAEALCVDDELWIFIYPYEYHNDTAKLTVLKYDFEGNKIGESLFPYEGLNYTYDGTYIWSITNGSLLNRYSKSGTYIDTRALPVSTFEVASDGQNLYFTDEIFTILKTDLEFGNQESIDPDYIAIANLTKFGAGFLCSLTEMICELNSSGELINVFILEDDMYMSRILTNGERIWGLYQDYGPDIDGTSVTLYELEVNSK